MYTYNLEGCHVLLPPQVLPVLGSEGGHAIVYVHPEVDKRVEQGMECAKSTCKQCQDSAVLGCLRQKTEAQLRKQYTKICFFWKNTDVNLYQYSEETLKRGLN